MNKASLSGVVVGLEKTKTGNEIRVAVQSEMTVIHVVCHDIQNLNVARTLTIGSPVTVNGKIGGASTVFSDEIIMEN